MTGVILDYTDEIARPSGWATDTQLIKIAALAELDTAETTELLRDPDAFLQSFVRSNDSLTWIEHPVVSYALDLAWEDFVFVTARSSVRSASVVHTFEGSIIGGQIAACASLTLLRPQEYRGDHD